MPESDGERCYRIKHPTEPHERIATQSELRFCCWPRMASPGTPPGPPMTLDTCGPSDGAIRTAVPGGKVMEWFSRRTSIADTQIPNWVLVLGVVIAFFLIYELIT